MDVKSVGFLKDFKYNPRFFHPRSLPTRPDALYSLYIYIVDAHGELGGSAFRDLLRNADLPISSLFHNMFSWPSVFQDVVP